MKRSIIIPFLITIPVIILFAIFTIISSNEQKVLAAVSGPCDIYTSGGTPCVAAYSTVRALYGTYDGNLYQVRRASDNTTKDIPVLTTGGVANAAVQDTFCAGTSCTISIIYDQSGKGNHLTKAPGGSEVYGPNPCVEADAKALPIMLGGHKVYGVHVVGAPSWTSPGQVGYRNTNTNGIPKGDNPESIYMVTDGTYYNGSCCFDFGNAEMQPVAGGYGTMESIYFGNCTWWDKGAGNGPWIMADLEAGVFNSGNPNGQWVTNPNDISFTYPFVTAMLKGNSANATNGGPFTLKGGNAQSGNLLSIYDGPFPPQYSPMHRQGGIVLGVGGDNSTGARGNFFEGVITNGYASTQVDAAIQANIIAAGYGSAITPPPTTTPPLTPTPISQQNPIWEGGPYTLNGTGDYVDLPDGLTSNLGDFSVACWVNLNTLDNWSRIFDFGGDTNMFMMLTPKSGSTGYPYFTLTTSGTSGEQGINATSTLPTGSWQHLAVVKNGNTGILYINKQEVGRNTNMTLKPADLGNTTNSYIGKSQWSQDPYLNGKVDKFYVYNRALSASEVTALGNTPPVDSLIGDVDGNGSITVVDALLIAQYSVGQDLSVFITANADVNCDGSIDIIDALLISQYVVGLLGSLGC